MFLFFIELYLLGGLVNSLFLGKLPRFFLAVSSVLIGYLVYFLNGFFLLLFGAPLTQTAMILLVTIELVGMAVFLLLRNRASIKSIGQYWSHILIVGIGYIGLILGFYFNNTFFATTDSVYLVVMGRNLLESGLEKWYFASPRGMGLFVPVLQTLGMIFGRDYTWFIQPVFMAVFLSLFVFLSLRLWKQKGNKKIWFYGLVGITTLLFFSSDLIFIMTTYIHTNFNSGLFLFLTIAALYFGVIEANRSWFTFTSLFLICFGAMRVENVIIALIVILVFIASKRIDPKVQKRVFLPYLVFQFILFFQILFMSPNTYSDQMSDGQVLVVMFGLLAMAGILFLVEKKIFRDVLFPIVWWALPVGLLVIVLGLGLLKSEQLLHNVLVNLKTLLITGNWGALWWVICAAISILPLKIRFPLKKELGSVILSFLLVIQLLGLFRVPYHDRWFDSANRMLVHIAPVILFYLLLFVANLKPETNCSVEEQ